MPELSTPPGTASTCRVRSSSTAGSNGAAVQLTVTPAGVWYVVSPNSVVMSPHGSGAGLTARTKRSPGGAAGPREAAPASWRAPHQPVTTFARMPPIVRHRPPAREAAYQTPAWGCSAVSSGSGVNRPSSTRPKYSPSPADGRYPPGGGTGRPVVSNPPISRCCTLGSADHTVPVAPDLAPAGTVARTRTCRPVRAEYSARTTPGGAAAKATTVRPPSVSSADSTGPGAASGTRRLRLIRSPAGPAVSRVRT